MAKILVLDMQPSSMDTEIAGKAGPLQVMTAPKGMGFKVEIEVDKKIEKEVNKDPLLHQVMEDAVKAVYDDLVDRIATNLKNTDKGAVTLRDNNDGPKLNKLIEVVNKGIVGARDVALRAAEKEVMNAWDKLCKTRKEYTKYKVKIFAKISLGVAGLATSIVLLATGAVSFGASSIPGIIGMAKTVVSIGAECKSAWDEIETAQKRLDKMLREIETKFVNAKGEFTTRGKAQEAGAILVGQLFGTSGAFAIIPNIKDAGQQLGTVKSKLGGVKVKSHDAAKTLNKILLEVEAAKKKFRNDCEKKLGKHPKASDTLKQIDSAMDEELAPFAKKVQDALGAVITFENRFKTAEPKVAFAEKRVAELIKLKGLGWKIFENALVFTDLATSFVDPTQYAKVGETLANILPAAGSLVADKLTKKILEGTILE